MFPKIFKKNKISSNSVAIYLFTLIIILFSSPFYQDTIFESIISNITFILNIISSIYIITKATGKKWVAYLGLVTILLFIFDLFIFSNSIGYFAKLIFVIISILALINIYHTIIKLPNKSNELSRDIFYAAIAGYLFIGVFGFILFQFIFELDPLSFLSNSNKEIRPFDLKYFSFVTLTTLGYGDIIPVTQKAKSLSVLIAIIGQLYLTIVMAMIVSEFLSKKRK